MSKVSLATYNGGVFDRIRRFVTRQREPFPDLPEISLRPIGERVAE